MTKRVKQWSQVVNWGGPFSAVRDNKESQKRRQGREKGETSIGSEKERSLTRKLSVNERASPPDSRRMSNWQGPWSTVTSHSTVRGQWSRYGLSWMAQYWSQPWLLLSRSRLASNSINSETMFFLFFGHLWPFIHSVLTDGRSIVTVLASLVLFLSLLEQHFGPCEIDISARKSCWRDCGADRR